MKWTPIQYFIPDIDVRYFLRVVENDEVMLVPAIYSGTYRSYMNVNNFYISEETITHILPCLSGLFAYHNPLPQERACF